MHPIMSGHARATTTQHPVLWRLSQPFHLGDRPWHSWQDTLSRFRLRTRCQACSRRPITTTSSMTTTTGKRANRRHCRGFRRTRRVAYPCGSRRLGCPRPPGRHRRGLSGSLSCRQRSGFHNALRAFSHRRRHRPSPQLSGPWPWPTAPAIPVHHSPHRSQATDIGSAGHCLAQHCQSIGAVP